MTRDDLIRALIAEYGHKREELIRMSDEELVELVVSDIRKELNV